MSDELPEWPTTPAVEDGPGIVPAIHDALHKALNENPSELGPQVLAKWIVIAEVNSMEGRGMRVIDADLMPWEWKGLMKHAKDMLERSDLLWDIDDEDDE